MTPLRTLVAAAAVALGLMAVSHLHPQAVAVMVMAMAMVVTITMAAIFHSGSGAGPIGDPVIGVLATGVLATGVLAIGPGTRMGRQSRMPPKRAFGSKANSLQQRRYPRQHRTRIRTRSNGGTGAPVLKAITRHVSTCSEGWQRVAPQPQRPDKHGVQTDSDRRHGGSNGLCHGTNRPDLRRRLESARALTSFNSTMRRAGSTRSRRPESRQMKQRPTRP